ncbi:MAG: cysteine methyltransferase [Gallionellales bacterium GWA2_60_18]|nr:MAG: cysteine methyltransferase [Gallionellales bacterium GWA2_60_18]
MTYQAKLKVPFGVLGIRCTADALTGIDFLAPGTPLQPPADAFAAKVCGQLLRYLDDPRAPFSVPLDLRGTPHQQKVWQAMQRISPGATRSYGELAAELGSGAQAIGQACGANPIPIVVPCHRVLGKSGLGGFMKHADGASLDIKRWLLAHEGAIPSPLAGEGQGRGG